jgi:iron complex transport system substrate-binding protein
MSNPRVPQRVVSLAASNTEIVCALGRSDLLVGLDDYSDFPPSILGLPRVGRDLEVDVARVAALEPDLVLASLSVPGMERNLARLDERGLPVYVVESDGLDGVLRAIQTVGDALGASGAARDLVSDFRSRIQTVQSAQAGRETVSVYWEWWPRPAIAAGGPSWVSEMLRIAGGRNVLEDEPRESLVVTLDQVRARNPDAVVICWCGARKLPSPRLIARRPGWESLEAVGAGRVYALLEPTFGRPGPRLVDGIETLAALLHPYAILQSA